MDKPVIDCDAQPFIPEGWEIRPEDQIPGAIGGNLIMDPGDFRIYQATGETGFEVAKALESCRLLKANVLDYFLANPKEIPSLYRTGSEKFVFFWGTIYRLPDGRPCVRWLWSDGEPPDWEYTCLENKIDKRDRVAVYRPIQTRVAK